ncbi:MAG: hypothetical protein SVP52_05060 [Chloroflexota bacterium]|nr:hypothetical protein [Chloroflexota bacterium]
MTDHSSLEKLIKKVQANQKYKTITSDLITRLSEKALSKGLSEKAAVKDVRNKLHQIGGAYFKQKVNYSQSLEDLGQTQKNLQSDQLRQYCKKLMGLHYSTSERLPIIERFFKNCMAPIAPVKSILDLACGMNPMAIPWMPLQPNFTYHACDIYMDMLDLIQSFFDHLEINGTTAACDLIGEIPAEHAQLAFLLKSIPCLEQVDKEIGLKLLESIHADHILVSFPVRSLSGRHKGMPNFYEKHFFDMISGKPWQIIKFTFQTELAFLVTK